MTTTAGPHRIFPPLREQRMMAENHPMLRPLSPAFNPPPPRGQRIPPAQLVLLEEMRQAQGRPARHS